MEKLFEIIHEDDGLLVITSYFDKEHQLALEALQGLGADLIETKHNPLARKLQTAGKSVDKHIAVLRRTSSVLPSIG